MLSRLQRLAPLILLLFAASCSTAAVAENMVPEHLDFGGARKGSVHVEVRGGDDSNLMWSGGFDNGDFAEALTATIQAHGPFETVVDSGGDYGLVVELLSIDRPGAGFNMTVSLISSWSLLLPGAADPITERVSSRYTATVGQAFAGVKRVRMATEGAGRTNIAEGLTAVAGHVTAAP